MATCEIGVYTEASELLDLVIEIAKSSVSETVDGFQVDAANGHLGGDLRAHLTDFIKMTRGTMPSETELDAIAGEILFDPTSYEPCYLSVGDDDDIIEPTGLIYTQRREEINAKLKGAKLVLALSEKELSTYEKVLSPNLGPTPEQIDAAKAIKAAEDAARRAAKVAEPTTLPASFKVSKLDPNLAIVTEKHWRTKYAVYHIPTGHVVGRFRLLKQAKLVIEWLAPVIDWSKTTFTEGERGVIELTISHLNEKFNEPRRN